MELLIPNRKEHKNTLQPAQIKHSISMKLSIVRAFSIHPQQKFSKINVVFPLCCCCCIVGVLHCPSCSKQLCFRAGSDSPKGIETLLSHATVFEWFPAQAAPVTHLITVCKQTGPEWFWKKTTHTQTRNKRLSPWVCWCLTDKDVNE